mmetsp:Transcript_8278/g.20656  ORF Transcript_8278/g.20656 Transcript_8278/m.20656 type:complete len:234 (-) Transcript_8278:435-1136(-)
MGAQSCKGSSDAFSRPRLQGRANESARGTRRASRAWACGYPSSSRVLGSDGERVGARWVSRSPAAKDLRHDGVPRVRPRDSRCTAALRSVRDRGRSREKGHALPHRSLQTQEADRRHGKTADMRQEGPQGRPPNWPRISRALSGARRKLRSLEIVRRGVRGAEARPRIRQANDSHVPCALLPADGAQESRADGRADRARGDASPCAVRLRGVRSFVLAGDERWAAADGESRPL